MSQSNTDNLTNDLGVARSLTWRYVIALILVATLSTSAWISLHLVIAKQESTAAVVNVSGRQRMLSQRTALFANLLALTPKAERAPIRDKLQQAIDLMAHSHHGLIHGDRAMELPDTMSPAVRAMYFDGPAALDGQVETYIKTVRALLQLDDNALTTDSPQLQYITKVGTTTLLSSLDKMVSQYQREGEASVKRLKKAETIFWVATLLLLVLEASLIFYPFARHVRYIIGKLQQVTEQLRLHEGQLEQAVRQRTAELETKGRDLAASEEKFRLISTAAKDAIAIIGAEDRIMYWNPAAEQIFGYTASEAAGKNLHNMLAYPHHHNAANDVPKDAQQYGVGNFVGRTFETTALHKDNSEFPVELSISAFMMQNSWHALAIIRDITERKQMEDQIRQLAFYDALTQLPNRRLLNDRLSQTIVALKRSGDYGALMFLDMDNFKSLNDTHGHGIGDLLLIEATRRLKNCVRETDTVARFGGDEFVVMLSKLGADKGTAATLAQNIAEKIRAALSEPYQLTARREGKPDTTIEHHCTVSIGIALFFDHEGNQDDIIKWADEAMYQAKESGRNAIQFFESHP